MHLWLLVFFGILSSEPADYLVIVPDALSQEITPLTEHRREQGLSVHLVSMDALARELGRVPTTADIKTVIQEEYSSQGKQLKYVLLVGDVGEGGMPTHRIPHYKWVITDKKEMATDIPYGDMEGDLSPEIALGRLPVRTPQELQRVVRKILQFEEGPRDGLQRLKLLLFGGTSGFPFPADPCLESATINMINAKIPLQYDLKILFGNLGSPYCPSPDEVGLRFIDLLNEGPALSVFAGHGSSTSCWGLDWIQKNFFMRCSFEKEQLGRLKKDTVAGPLFCISCDNGFFDGEESCLAEETLLNPGGPVAVVASSRNSHPLTNLYFAHVLVESLYQHDTLGKLFLHVLETSYRKSGTLANLLLRDAEGSLDGEIDVGRLKKDQVQVYNLLGDPATRILFPRSLEVKAALSADKTAIDVEASAPFDPAQGFVALFRARSWKPPYYRLPDPETSEKSWRRLKNETFQEVNQKEVLRFPVKTEGRELMTRIALDDVLPAGKYRLVLYLKAGKKDAAGAVPLIFPAD